jgi:hypothetical protein
MLKSLEIALEWGIRLEQGRVFADLWDVKRLNHCSLCGAARVERLRQMNDRQGLPPPILCDCTEAS